VHTVVEQVVEGASFEVRGVPIQQGSARAFVIPGKGGRKPRAVVTHDSRRDLGAWRRLVSDVAQSHAPPTLWSGPVVVDLVFHLPRPKSEPTAIGRGKARRPLRTWPVRKPDLDKLVRAVIDSLTNVFFEDDSQVVGITAIKDWGTPGVGITLSRLIDTTSPGTNI
jgi:crossover junction endodeoxyribonuclease RusA